MDASGSTGLSVQTSDFDEVVSTMRDVFGDVDVRRDEDRCASLRMRSRGTEGLRLIRWAMSGSCGGLLERGDARPAGVLLGIRVAGDVELRSGGALLDTTRPYLCPDSIESRIASSDIVNIEVDRALLEARARASVGADDLELRFTGTAPVSDAAGEVWRDTVAYATRALALIEDDPGSEVLRATLLDLVASVLLQTFPSTATEAAAYGSANASAAVRRALQYVDEHLTEPFGAPDLASAARMSLRGLHAAFRRELDATPMAYVRSARLSAARDELRSLDPERADLASTAARWGFPSTRQFSALYTRTFGETPADTLRG